MDKATKLELIYDRIHEIRLRFEVLKCEKEIASLRSRIPDTSLIEPDLKLEETLRQLDNDFYFIDVILAASPSPIALWRVSMTLPVINGRERSMIPWVFPAPN